MLVKEDTWLTQLNCEPEKPEPIQHGSNMNSSKQIVGKTGRVNVPQPEDQLLSIGELSLEGKETIGSLQEARSTIAACSEVSCTTQPSVNQATTTTITPSTQFSNDKLPIGEARMKTMEGS